MSAPKSPPKTAKSSKAKSSKAKSPKTTTPKDSTATRRRLKMLLAALGAGAAVGGAAYLARDTAPMQRVRSGASSAYGRASNMSRSAYGRMFPGRQMNAPAMNTPAQNAMIMNEVMNSPPPPGFTRENKINVPKNANVYSTTVGGKPAAAVPATFTTQLVRAGKVAGAGALGAAGLAGASYYGMHDNERVDAHNALTGKVGGNNRIQRASKLGVAGYAGLKRVPKKLMTNGPLAGKAVINGVKAGAAAVKKRMKVNK